MIPIRNIYYMLAYAFQALTAAGYRELATEEFENTADLCAAILCKGTSKLIKQGLGREYVDRKEQLTAIKGKIDLSDSIKTRATMRNQLVCSYDDYSVNIPMNQIIKTTMTLLLHADTSKERKREIRKLLAYFTEIDLLEVHQINWERKYNRNNEQYHLLISICYLVIKGLLQTTENGTVKLMEFLDEQRMSRLYEKFILEYYRKHFPELHASASQIPWVLDDEEDDMLPQMRSDITLSQGSHVLIIDAKYYGSTTQQRFDARTIHSHNLYQIFTYVKNKEAEMTDVSERQVSGMLLYARTDEMIQPDHTYSMSGNKISVKTLDLNCDFDNLKMQLDEVRNYI